MDEINIDRIKVFARHGVFDFEKRDGQDFYISIRLGIDRLTASDCIDDTVHYGEVALLAKKLAEECVYDLIESVANSIARGVMLAFPKVKEIDVRVDKPNAPIPLEFSGVSVTVKRARHIAYLALGSNMGNRKAYLDGVLRAVNAEEDSELLATSSYHETKPYGVTDQADFLNAVIKISTLKSPEELLDFAHSLENKAGRVRTRRWGERTLDVDILAYDDLALYGDSLIIPHAEMHKRDFVLRPMAEIAGEFVHPVMRKTVDTLLKELENENADN